MIFGRCKVKLWKCGGRPLFDRQLGVATPWISPLAACVQKRQGFVALSQSANSCQGAMLQ